MSGALAWPPPPADHDERRRDRRYPCSRSAFLALAQGGYPCMMENISAGGARITTSARVPVGTDVRLCLDGWDAIAAQVVYSTGLAIGLRFIQDETARRRLQGWIESHLV